MNKLKPIKGTISKIQEELARIGRQYTVVIASGSIIVSNNGTAIKVTKTLNPILEFLSRIPDKE